MDGRAHALFNGGMPQSHHVAAISDKEAAESLPRRTPPFGTKTQVARGLLQLHCRLRGELAKAGSGEGQLIPVADAKRYMLHIEALMPLLGVDFDPASLPAIRTRQQIGHLDWGELRTGTLKVLRLNGGWMTYREIMETLLARNRVTLSDHDKTRFLQKVREALFFQMKAGAVEREQVISLGAHDQIQRFRLSPTLFRR